ncbi:transmembrane repetitive protein [Xanthomonas hydrangeae]|uniref:Transmembrane repetitive protein n=1 Tax=Xanthomonas hydrangeae TaxID=2775159 RepID=A0AAU0B8N3_9XANT|nr:transmembrane repetitive protein [Xanthomonas hydrangeae]WOB49440.1 transmembrane repetitive protein [Xanthomonas hydrangeae]
MTTAADLLQALRARMPSKLILDRRTGLPYGWATWMRNRDSVVAPFDRGQVTDVLLARPALPHSMRTAALLSPFQAFRSLWWQHWEPRRKDERPLHWRALLGSFLIHLGFIALLIWVVSVRWAPDETEQGDESRVRMSFIGEGAAEQGGGEGEPGAQAAPGEASTAPQANAPAASGNPTASATPPPQPTQATAGSVDSSSVAEAQQVAPEPVAAVSKPTTPDVPQVRVQVSPVTIESPLQVTETPVATNDFVVPPPPTIAVAPRPIEAAAPQIQVRQREIQTVTEQPQLRELQRPATNVAVRPATAPAVREREIVVPDRPQVVAPVVRSRELTPTVRMPEIAVRTAELPSVPDPAPQLQPAVTAPAQSTPTIPSPTTSAANAAAQPTPSTAPSTPSQATQSRSEQSTSAAAASSSSKPATNSSAGPQPADRSGGWDVATKADDWSKSDRNREGKTTGANGQRDGMFYADGSVRVAAETGDTGNSAGRRGPPGSDTDTWSRDQIAQGGTWLKRPPYGYTPTSLDKYWMPNQSLLQEWVRRGLKKIEIPIPGTTTKISCVVSLLQFGGGCGLSDPNLNEQPATARPPPDVPFKRELQEDNGAVR